MVDDDRRSESATEDVDLSTVFKGSDGVSIDEGERLLFAKQILFGLAILSAGVFIGHGVYPDNKAVSDISN